MKKLNILFLSVLAVGIAITSCSKSDNTTPAPQILGSWTFSTVQALDSSGNPTGDAAIYTGLGQENDPTCSPRTFDTINFTTATDLNYTDYPSSGCTFPTNSMHTYSLSGANLTLNMGGATPLTAVVLSVSTTKLILKIPTNSAGTTFAQLVLNKN